MTTFLKSERDGAVLTLTMNQPETRNALTGNTAVEGSFRPAPPSR